MRRRGRHRVFGWTAPPGCTDRFDTEGEVADSDGVGPDSDGRHRLAVDPTCQPGIAVAVAVARTHWWSGEWGRLRAKT